MSERGVDLLRKDLLEHDATCGERKVPCRHCKFLVARIGSLAEHEVAVMVECPNEGCSAPCTRGD
jgi:hypothetical protein